jgi:UDP-glucose 4-epimerase
MRGLSTITSNPSALITGSRGFLGRWLTRRLQSGGWRVAEWKGDVRTIASCDEKVDVVFHLAALVGNDRFLAEPDQGYDVNVTGTVAVLNYCYRAGAKCVLASTSGVYQPTEDWAIISEDSPIDTSQPYNISKWLAERVCYRQATDLEVACVVLRIFNAYGPGQPSSFLVAYVLDCLTRGVPITLRLPQASRDFIYVDDVAEALIKAAQLQARGFSMFNIGTGRGTKVIDLVRAAETVYGEAVGVELADTQSGRAASFVADFKNARQQLNWSPKYDLESGLAAIKVHSAQTAIVPDGGG